MKLKTNRLSENCYFIIILFKIFLKLQQKIAPIWNDFLLSCLMFNILILADWCELEAISNATCHIEWLTIRILPKIIANAQFVFFIKDIGDVELKIKIWVG